MIEILKEHPKAALFAAIFHVIVVIVVGVSVDWTSLTEPSGENKPVKIVNAVAVDQKLLDNELKKIKQAEKQRVKKQKDAERRKKKAIVDRKREEKKLNELKRKNKKEKAKQLALKKKRDADKKADNKRKLKVKKAQQKKAAADKKKAAAEKKKAAKLAEQQKRKEQFETELKQKMAKEEAERQAQIAAANLAKRQSEIGKYIQRIKLKVENNWITFRTKKLGKFTVVRVKVIPGGAVLDAKTITPSGDDIFDKDAVTAVYKASPLPIPPADTDLINDFREFDLKIGTPK